MSIRTIVLIIFVFLSFASVESKENVNPNKSKTEIPDLVQQDLSSKPNSYWKNKLSPGVYQVTRCSATEAPFTGKYWNNHDDGIYKCSNCGAILFDSKSKFDSGTGWPSFDKAQNNSVKTRVDRSFNSVRDEVICKNCGAHLGHLFDDGPTATGQRYCINSASLDFQKEEEGKKK